VSSLFKSDPVREFEEFGRRMMPWFGRFGQEAVPDAGKSMTVFDWMPSVDVVEEDDAYVLSVELPDVKKKDIKLTVENRILSISGERKKEWEEDEGVRYHRVERCYGSFYRSFSLPDDADPAELTATMKGGILKVRIEKHSETSTKAIPIQSEHEEEEEE